MSRPPKSSSEPPEFRFRTKPVQERSVFESWAVLPAKTRLRISLAITVFAGIGILVSDKLETIFPAPAPAPKPSNPPSTSPSSSS